jgi:hypothetical protein
MAQIPNKDSIYFAFSKKQSLPSLSIKEKNVTNPKNLKKLKQKLALKNQTKEKNEKKVTQLEQALVKYEKTPDEVLLEASLPKAHMENKANYKLSPEQREARLVYVHRQLIRGANHVEISKKLNISVAMFYAIKNDLEQRLRDTLIFLDIPQVIGDSLHFYDDVRTVALSYTQEDSPHHPKIKLEALKVALEAERDKNNFLKTLGVYGKELETLIIKKIVSPTGQTFDQTAEEVSHENIVQDIVSSIRTLSSKRTDSPIETPQSTPTDTPSIEPSAGDPQEEELDITPL